MATKILAAERQVTRLGAGVFRDGRITADAMAFVCANLERMAQIYQKLDVIGVRAVATSAVRDASNQQEFWNAQPRPWLAGGDYLGARGSAADSPGRAGSLAASGQTRPDGRCRGGSAEVILSEHGVLAEAFSKPLGAVRLTECSCDPIRPDPSICAA